MKIDLLRSGRYEKFGEYNHFVPNKLPPVPAIVPDKELFELYGEAMQSLGKLAEAQKRIPAKRQFHDIYIAKEAVYSSKIENINTTLTQILEYKSKETTENKDTQEVFNYINALHYGMELMREKNLPISSRLIKECHKKLLAGVRGESKTPGEYRKVPVFVGSLVPPPAHYIESLISDWEKFVNDDDSILPLIKTGLAHVQFETIHPFLDGNGRIGRLLIVLMMIEYGIINEPMLYPSLFFMKFRNDYYSKLDGVREKGDYEAWIKYFLQAIKTCADDLVIRAWEIDSLLEKFISELDNKPAGVRKNATRLLYQLCHTPIMSINDVADLLQSTYLTAQKLVTIFVDLGILKQENSQQRNKVYGFRSYLTILEREFSGVSAGLK